MNFLQRRARPALCASGAALLFAIVLASCGPVRNEPPALDGSPAARGPMTGLEIITWSVSSPVRTNNAALSRRGSPSPPLPLAQALAPYLARPVCIAESTRDEWRACGVGVVCVPVGDLEALRSRLVMSGPVQAQQVLLSPRWTRAILGPRTNASEVFELDEGLMRLDRGALALLVRSWAAPAPDVTSSLAGDPLAVARVQVVPQVVSDALARTRERSSFGPSTLPSEEDKGQVISRLMLDAVCDGTQALVLYPISFDAAPVQVESEPARPRSDEPMPADEAPRVPEKQLVRRDGMGPQTPRAPSLGEALLTPVLLGGAREPTSVLVIVPHPPARFQLVGLGH